MSSPFEPRKINTRKPYQMDRPYDSDCQEIKRHFDISRDELKSITGCLSFNGKSTEQQEEAQNYLYRSQIIMAYSAFDLFMHEILYFSFKKMRKTGAMLTSEYINKYTHVQKDNDEEFKEVFSTEYGYRTLTSRDWGNALSWMGLNRKTVAMNYLMKYENMFDGKPEEAYTVLKEEILDKKTERRNKLVHSYDYNVPGGEQEKIDRKTAKEFIAFVSNLVGIVFDSVYEKWNRTTSGNQSRRQYGSSVFR